MGVLAPYMANANEWNRGFRTGWFYAGIGLPFTIGMWFLIPETARQVLAPIPPPPPVELFRLIFIPFLMRHVYSGGAGIRRFAC